MIVFQHRNLLLITPPKCGSTSLHQHFCLNTKEGTFVIGPQGDGNEVDKHTVHVPFNFKQYDIYVVVRNPRDRFVSLFKHYLRWHNPHATFEQYVELYHNKAHGWFYQWTIRQFVTRMTEPFKLLHIETIDADLRKLGFGDLHLPKINHHVTPSEMHKYLVPESWIESDVPPPRT